MKKVDCPACGGTGNLDLDQAIESLCIGANEVESFVMDDHVVVPFCALTEPQMRVALRQFIERQPVKYLNKRCRGRTPAGSQLGLGFFPPFHKRAPGRSEPDSAFIVRRVGESEYILLGRSPESVWDQDLGAMFKYPLAARTRGEKGL
jgi:hypothetical protein